MIVIGVDPGKGGAIAVLDPELRLKLNALYLYPMPVVTSAKGRDEYDKARIASILHTCGTGLGRGVTVFLEKPQPIPAKRADGKAMGGFMTNFQRGYTLGLFEGLLTALGIPYELVAPRVWQATMHAGTSGDDLKQRSIMAAQRLFPGVSLHRTDRSKKPDDGMAEALLIAEWGRRKLAGGEMFAQKEAAHA